MCICIYIYTYIRIYVYIYILWDYIAGLMIRGRGFLSFCGTRGPASSGRPSAHHLRCFCSTGLYGYLGFRSLGNGERN